MYQIRSVIKRVNVLFLFKAGIGSAIAIWLASSLGLLYSPSAGIITLLTIQNTKKETLEIAVRRILAFLLAVGSSYIVFQGIGYNSAAFGVFILVFVGLCIALKLQDGISMNAVLMTHFLVEGHMSFHLVANEVFILFIGMGIGVVLNLFMPKFKNRIRKEQLAVEEAMREVLRSLARILMTKDACLIQEDYILVQDGNRPVQEDDNQVHDNDRPVQGGNHLEQDGNHPVQGGNHLEQDGNHPVQDGNHLEQDGNHPVQGGNHLEQDGDNQGQDSDTPVQDGDNPVQDSNNRVSTGNSNDRFNQPHMIQSDVEYRNNLISQASHIDAEFNQLDSMLEGLLKRAYENAGNTLINNTRYLVTYLEMRKHQVDVLKSIRDNINQIPVLLRQSIPLADFMVKTAASYHELNDVEELLLELKSLNQHYKNEALPVTREEFEYRAVLFQILKQLEYFLVIKRSFVKELEETNMKMYWN